MGKGAIFLKNRTAALLIAVMLLVSSLALLSSCAAQRSSDELFVAAMESVRALDTGSFSQYFAESAYFDAFMQNVDGLSESGRQASEALYSSISWEVLEAQPSFLRVKIASFDFDRLLRYVEDSYALGTGTDKAQILLSLISGGRLSSYVREYEIRVNIKDDDGGMRIPFDTAENSELLNALGLVRVIGLFTK